MNKLSENVLWETCDGVQRNFEPTKLIACLVFLDNIFEKLLKFIPFENLEVNLIKIVNKSVTLLKFIYCEKATRFKCLPTCFEIA